MTYKTVLRVREKLTLTFELIILLTFAFSNFLSAKNAQSIFDLMHYGEVLEMTLETDLTFLKENRRNGEYQKANIRFLDKNGNQQKWNLKVRLRGNFRRLNCTDIPPLKWKFKKSDLDSAGLSEFNDMKMVATCIEDKEAARIALMKEYLTYKLYNSLTEKSFRVQLLRLTYNDVSTGEKLKSWAFLIEDTAQLRDRIGAEKCEGCLGLTHEEFDQNTLKIMSLFQYMIGNSDWDIFTRRNFKIVKKDGLYIPIPYDFDFSGLVNAPYAIPNPDYRLLSIQERVYIGFPSDVESLHTTLQYFYGKRKTFKKVIQNFKPLCHAGRREMIAYLNSYFSNFEDIRIGEKNIQIITTNP